MTLEICGLSFGYPGARKMTLDGIDLMIDDDQIYSLLGGSGSGKTTLLNLIAGFISPSSGKIILDGKEITSERIERRNIGVVFQDYALFPHMTVEGNIGFGPRARGFSRKKVGKITSEMIELVGLEGYSKRRPSELSGGEKQRVALARTLAVRPKVILLDEPLSALDTSLRESIRNELRAILREQKVITLYVTHDRSEALSLSDRIGVLNGGKIIEEGSPRQIYWRPRDIKTARFMGFSNSIPFNGPKNGLLTTEYGDVPMKVDRGMNRLMFRPESANFTGDGGITIDGMITGVEYRGNDQLLDVRSGARKFRIVAPSHLQFQMGEKVLFTIPYSSLVPFRA